MRPLASSLLLLLLLLLALVAVASASNGDERRLQTNNQTTPGTIAFQIHRVVKKHRSRRAHHALLTRAQRARRRRRRHHHQSVPTASPTLASTDGVEELPMLDQSNLAWTAKVGLGTPPQYVECLLDTGSSNLWTAVKGVTPAIAGATLYDPSKSSTVVHTSASFSIQYLLGSATGTYVTDKVTIAGMTIPSYRFADVTKTADMGLNKDMVCIAGMAFNGLVKDGGPSLLSALVASGDLARPEISFYLGRSGASEVTLGGSDPTKYTGAGTNVPLVTAAYWLIKVDSASLGTTTLEHTDQAIVDTGTSYLMAPKVVFNALVAGTGAVYNRNTEGYQVACSVASSGPTLTIVLAGTAFKLAATDYVYQYSASYCELGVFSGEGSGFSGWILGDTFMLKYYAVFNYGTASNPASVVFYEAV